MRKITKTEFPDHFWGKVRIKGKNECWEWKNPKSRNDYISFRILGRTTSCHRISWELTFGAIPSGLFVLHHCDNPICVNPNHLFLGTQTDNMRDKMEKGRWRGNNLCGEKASNVKLSKRDVLRILNLSRRGKTRYELADKFGVSYSAIKSILTGNSWSSITGIEKEK